jgi:hypothetical protein
MGDVGERRGQIRVRALPRVRVAAVLRQEEADIVALICSRDELEPEIQDRGVAREGAGIDDGQHGDGRNLHVVGGADVGAAGDVVDAGLRMGGGRRAQNEKRSRQDDAKRNASGRERGAP